MSTMCTVGWSEPLLGWMGGAVHCDLDLYFGLDRSGTVFYICSLPRSPGRDLWTNPGEWTLTDDHWAHQALVTT